MLFESQQKLDVTNRWCSIFIKVAAGISAVIVLMYLSYFYASPSVTLENRSEFVIESAIINLPLSRLDFGEIHTSQDNTIYYDLAQLDGQYEYHLLLDSGDLLEGTCGYITNFEINKRVVLVLNDIGEISCQF
ncbi:hypothetical protein BCU84_04090 [Shewanella sp. 10N.286.51.B7]|uniref:hypothetical protein n=1 Tax=Shewanella sp. 10N.286.51.B7 TaxID=1880836 RepID=UPI000C823A90|nr:hypothetical protein [Shewanella sp. 10N.286.51.B7]PMG80282.1 hypothetical protein BCU84_04090 [Shewanella sp. 10N.286.51.B7]